MANKRDRTSVTCLGGVSGQSNMLLSLAECGVKLKKIYLLFDPFWTPYC
jgi:hypothetical protein